jgi:membrane protease YdiL (CAAX protease family)
MNKMESTSALVTNEVVIAAFMIIFTLLLYLAFLKTLAHLKKRYATHQLAFSYKPTLRRFFLEKLSGFLIFGIIPFIAAFVLISFRPAEMGLKWFRHSWDIPLLAAIIILVCIVTNRAALKEKTYRKYPQIRLHSWTIPVFFTSYSGWVIYLFAYEFLFRGLLLSACLPFGIWQASAINCTIYAIVHIHQGKGEIIGSVFFGLVLCLLTIYTGSILAPFLVHLSLSISTELWSIKNNPKTRVLWMQIPTL